MKKINLIKKFKSSNICIILIILIIITGKSFVFVNADNGDSIEVVCSKALVDLKIMRGDEKGNLNLQNKVTRREMIALINRMMAYDCEIDNDELITLDTIPFKDVNQKDWAYKDYVIALNHSLIKGYTDNTLRPNNYISLAEANALIIRALGYENIINKEWPDGIMEKSNELELNINLNAAADKLLTRGEASIIIYNALTVKFFE